MPICLYITQNQMFLLYRHVSCIKESEIAVFLSLCHFVKLMDSIKTKKKECSAEITPLG